MVGTYYRRTAGAILVFDITDYNSFADCENWVSELKDYNEDNCKLIVVGNKVDLENKNRAVSTAEAEAFAQKHDAAYFEVSAKEGTQVQEMFDTLINKIIECIKQMETMGNIIDVKSTFNHSVKVNSSYDRKDKKKKGCPC